MKKWQALLSAAVLAAGIGLGGISQAAETAAPAAAPAAVTVENGEERIVGKVLGKQVIELPVFTDIDYKAGLALDAEHFGKYGCSAVAKVLPNGDMVVGRSMDLNVTNKPAYIIRTAVPGFLKTVGLAYNPFGGPDFDEAKEIGIKKIDTLPLLFFTIDIMNEKGVYIEGNMRNAENEELTGLKECFSTNPGAEYRMSPGALIRFLGERAGSVEEAVALAKTVDVHSLKSGTLDWNAGIYIADATGKYGILELVDNQLVWLPGEPLQSNFFLSRGNRDRALYGAGFGRYETLKAGRDAVQTEADMMKLISLVRFSQSLDPATCPFDVRTEYTGEHVPGIGADGEKMTVDQALDEKNRPILDAAIQKVTAAERAKGLETLKKEGQLWYSIWQVVANCNRQSIHAMFFEDPTLVFDVTVEK